MSTSPRPESAYHRPNQTWECGRACTGCACQAGPTRWGRCSDQANPCRPRLSLRHRRRWFVIACFLCSLGFLSLGLHPSVRLEFLAPGPLTSPHAQILQRSGQQNRCAACHPAGDQSPSNWFASVLACAKECKTTQTELCLKCHERQIPAALATLPHNLPREVLERKSAAQRQRAAADHPALATLLAWTGRRDQPESQQLACAACHREHHGAGFDLQALTDQQCQSCHQGEFHSFSRGHPEFQHYGGQSPRQIPFNHATHAHKHFREKKANFECQRCHESDATGQVQRLVDYRRACADCHDQPLRTVHQEGWVVFALPTVDLERAEKTGVRVARWPGSAQGDCDGRLPPVLAVLLLADPATAPAVRSLAPSFDFSQLNLENAQHMALAGQVANGIAKFVEELQQRPTECVRQRLETVLRRPLTAEEQRRLDASLPAAALAAATQRWLANSSPHVTGPLTEPPSPQRESVASHERRRFHLAAWAPSSEALLDNPLSSRREKGTAAAPEPAATSVSPQPKHTEPTPALVRPEPTGPRPAPGASATNAKSATIPRTTATPPRDGIPAASDGDSLADNPLRNRRVSDPSDTAIPTPQPESTPTEQPAARSASGKTVDHPSPAAQVQLAPPAVRWAPAAVPPKSGEPLVDNPLNNRREPATTPSASPQSVPTEPQPQQPAATPTSPAIALPPAVEPPAVEPPAVETPAVETPAESTTGTLPPSAPATTPSPTETNAGSWPPGWTVNDQTLSIRYSPQGHADPVMKFWIEILRQLPTDLEGVGGLQEASRHCATTQACARCHQWSPEQSPSLALWRVAARDPSQHGFTKFSHRPHLLQPQLRDCSHCHQLAEAGTVTSSETNREVASPAPQVSAGTTNHDFLPLRKNACVNCHRAGSTSESCTQCHRYHVHLQPLAK